jgi:hypothetical protein
MMARTTATIIAATQALIKVVMGTVGRGRSDVPGLRMLIHALEDAVELRLCRAAL